MERIITLAVGLLIILGSNFMSIITNDSVIIDTSVIRLTNLGALTLTGIGLIIYSIPPVVFGKIGKFFMWVLSAVRGGSSKGQDGAV